MEPIAQLRQALRSINETAFEGLYFDLRPIQQEIKKLKLVINKPDSRPPVDLIQVAMGSFLNTSTLNSFRDIRLVSYGAATPLGLNQIRLIEKTDYFPKLLDIINGYLDQPRAFRRLYRGLLTSYFSYDPEAQNAKDPGPHYWKRLRLYLNEHIVHLHTEGTIPDWVAALQEHQNLLTEDPCSRYAQAFLNGTSNAFEDAEQRLGFSGTSWISRAVVAARIDAVIGLPDSEFKRYLSDLIRLISHPRHAILVNQCLAKLLNRYAKTQPLLIHHELRNFAVDCWKNPWLEINRYHWALVSESTRKMVESWLKLDLIQNFFELLSADGSNDIRRLNFWISYVDQITDMYFGLGRYAMRNQDSSFITLRNKMAGRLLRLSGAGRENNAFIMVIGNHTFVEFGMQGHAVYVYKQFPFALDSVNDINLNELKDKTTIIERLHHKDNVHGYDRWERRFNAHLYQSFRIRVSNTSEIPEPWRSGSYYTTGNIENIKVFCQAFGFNIQDETQLGGYFWILTDNEKSIVCQQLQAWDFTYRNAKGWYLNG